LGGGLHLIKTKISRKDEFKMDLKLKELLGEELVKKLETKLKDVKIGIVNDGSWVPKEKFDNKTEELKLTKQQVDQYKENSSKVETLLKDNEALKTQYNELKTTHETVLTEKDKEISYITKKSVLSKALKENGARYDDLLMSKIDLESVNIENETIKGLDELINPLKEKYSDMFESKQVTGNKPSSGVKDQIVNPEEMDFSFMDNLK
jgi:hypothetical protein